MLAETLIIMLPESHWLYRSVCDRSHSRSLSGEWQSRGSLKLCMAEMILGLVNLLGWEQSAAESINNHYKHLLHYMSKQR